MSTFPVRSDNRFMRGTHGGRIRMAQIAWYEETPALAAAAAVLAATTLDAAVATTVTGDAITQPDVARTISIKGNAASCAGNVVITGADANNRPLTATLALNGTSVVTSVVAFARVTKIVLPVRVAAGNTVQVGTGAALGLMHELDADVRLSTTFDGATDAGTLAIDNDEVSKNLFTPAGTLDGAKVLRILYVV